MFLWLSRVRQLMDGTSPPGGLSAPVYDRSCWLFLRLLGIVYGIAFASLWPQLPGLVGPLGILPADQLLHAAARQLGPARFWLVPTLAWFGASDMWLSGLCVAGVVVSALLAFDIAPALSAFAAWLLYLSFVSIGRDFLSFQWDSLLLEAGFLAIWLAPLRLRSSAADDPPAPRLVRWLLWWLLFRLMFSSGVVKLSSHDPTWRNLTALTYHYETQPIPNPLSWYMHQLPTWWHRFETLLVFVFELVVPLGVFAPRRVRRATAWTLIAFQLLLIATGNYAFFNWLAVALCVPLLDDAAWPLRLWRRPPADQAARSARAWPQWLVAPMAVAIAVISIVPMVLIFRDDEAAAPIRPLVRLYAAVSPIRLVNGYGLFAMMTTSRPEIIIEGSDDQQHWRAYEFRFKAGDVHHAPPQVAPYQPRLDWQMWFAALGDYRSNTWFLVLCRRLLQGSPPVLQLLADNPFPHAPPKYVRAVVYDYHFTTWRERRATGAWWRRELKGLYCPILSLRAMPTGGSEN